MGDRVQDKPDTMIIRLTPWAFDRVKPSVGMPFECMIEDQEVKGVLIGTSPKTNEVTVSLEHGL